MGSRIGDAHVLGASSDGVGPGLARRTARLAQRQVLPRVARHVAW